MQIAANKAVSIDYTLTNDEGEVLDSSVGGAPLVYLHGAGNIIPGLEKALEGKQSGDEIKVTVEPEEAYGDFNAELIAVLGRNMFEGVDELEVGMQFHASGPDGSMQIVTIKALEGDEVTVEPEEAYGDFNAELIAVLGRNMFEGVDELEVGMQFHASGPDGSMQIVTIKALEGDEVTVDGNHPLAGERLTFEVKVVEVRDAQDEEIAHGHVHGEGGHHH